MNLSEQDRAVSSVLRAIDAIKNGRMVVMVDDEDRENEGDLVIAADAVTPEHVNFMAKEARGLICLTLEPSIVKRLDLPMMGKYHPTHSHGTAFTVSIEARHGVTTGISAHDRAHTVKVAVNPNASPEDIVVPGHIFPLRARPGGVLERAGHTEGSVDLARLAGFTGAGVICEIMNDDGTMARMPDLRRFAEKHDLPIVAIADLITYRLLNESLVRETYRKPITTPHGTFEGILFESTLEEGQHLALVKGAGTFTNEVADVRVQIQSPLVDALGASSVMSRSRLEYGLRMLASVERGVFLYLLPTGRCDALMAMDELAGDKESLAKRQAAAPPLDMRVIGTGAQILHQLGVSRMRLHTSSDRPLKGLAGFGLEVVDKKIIESQP